MKKIYSLLLLLTAMMVLSSCKNEVDDIFEKSSSERVADALKSYKDILVAAPNGWRMQYVANEQYGGYNMLCKFKADNTVDVANDKGVAANGTHYQIIQSQGALLSFDEYNKAMHMFSDPIAEVGIAGRGFEGDFEFRVLSAAADSVVLEGKKHGSRIVMTPMPAETKWADYLEAVNKTMEAMDADHLKLTLGEEVLDCTLANRVLSVTDKEGNTMGYPVVYTPTGLDLTDTVTIASKLVTGFTYSADDNWLDRNDKTVKLSPFFPPLPELFVGAMWTPNVEKSAASVMTMWKRIAAINGQNNFPVNYCYMGTDSEMGSNFGLVLQLGRYWGLIGIDYEIVDGETITFKAVAKGDANGNGDYFYKNLIWNSVIATFIPKGNPGTFKVTANDPKRPTEITLTSVADPTVKIVFDKGPQPTPFG